MELKVTDNAKVPRGYQITEVGVIPVDWEVQSISDVCKLINGRGFKPLEWKNNGLPIIRIQNLNGSNEFNYYQGQYDKKIEVDNGQLLFAWSGSRGTSFGPHIWRGNKGLLNYHTWKIISDGDKIDGDFFLYCLRQLTKFIEDKAHGASALVHTQKWEMEGFEFPCPINRKEQTAIATILFDTDELLQTLEKKIAKKSLIRQGAIQELLKIKDGSKLRSLGEVGKCYRGVSYNAERDLYPFDNEFTVRLLRSNNIQNSAIKLTEIQFVSNERVSDNQIMHSSDILICMANGSKALVGKAALFSIKDEFNYTFGAFMACFKTTCTDSDPKYIYYNFKSFNYRSFIDVLLSGSSINNLKPSDIESIKIPFPSKAEQTRIATILSDMDNEIEQLEQKLAKYKQLKQGLMQNLLTGKIRLV